MDVNEFRADMLEEVHLNATMNGTTPHEEFLALCVCLCSHRCGGT